MRITYAKLKDGETWGIRVQDGQVQEGQRVQVWTKAGKAVEETVLKVVSYGDGWQICEVVPKPKRGGGRGRPQAPKCCPHCGKNLSAPVQRPNIVDQAVANAQGRPYATAKAPQAPPRAPAWQPGPRPSFVAQRPPQGPQTPWGRQQAAPQDDRPPPPMEEPPQRRSWGHAGF